MRTYSMLCLILTLCAQKATAQNFSVKQLDARDGLSSCYPVSMAEDKCGNIWIATEEGLNKFNGNTFINYYKSSGLSGNELNKVADDLTDSIIWIATQRNGLNSLNYKTGKITVYPVGTSEKSPSIDAITDIFCEKNGIWIASYWGEVNFYNKKSQEFIRYNNKTIKEWTQEKIRCIKKYGNKLFIGYFNGGLGILNIENHSFKKFTAGNKSDSLPGNTVICIYKDSSNNIWIGTDNGVVLFNQFENKFHRFNREKYPELCSNSVFDIIEDQDGKILIAREMGGILLTDISKGIDNISLSLITDGFNEHSLSGLSVRCLINDRFNNIWAGIWASGVNFIYNDNAFFHKTVYGTMQTATGNLNTKSVLSVCASPINKKVYVGTDGGGVNVFSQGKREAILQKENNQLLNNCVQVSFCDLSGNLWFGFFNGGLTRYNPQTGKSLHILFTGNFNDIRCIYQKDNREVFIGTSEGIKVLDVNTLKETKTIKLKQNLVRAITIDSFNRIWAGTFGGGLIVCDSTGKEIKNFKTNDGKFPSNTINQLYKDCYGYIWVATGEGPVCFNKADSERNNFDFTVYNGRNLLNNNHIRAINQDGEGNIWFSTNKGLSCLIREENRFVNFTEKDNLPQGGFNSASSTHAANGDLYFGAVNGLCNFNPEAVLKGLPVPKPVISSFNVLMPENNFDASESRVDIPVDNTIELSFEQNSFAFAVNAQNYALNQSAEYSYQIVGLNNNVFKIQNNNEVIFRNLPSGMYTVRIFCKMPCSLSDDLIFTDLNITINPPFWRSKLALFVYFVIICAIVFLVFFAYRRRLKISYQLKIETQKHIQETKLNDERMKFYTNITHELKTPLTLIIGPLDDLSKDQSIPPEISPKINSVKENSLKLLKLINKLLDFRKASLGYKQLAVKFGKLSEIVMHIGLKFKESNLNKNLDIEISVPDSDPEIYYDEDIISSILENLISNAVKYTARGYVRIGLKQVIHNNKQCMEISVADSGTGISKEALPKIFNRYYQENTGHQASGTGIGLSLVKDFVELHKAEITVESVVNQYSVFNVYLSVNESYSDSQRVEKKPASEIILQEHEKSEIIQAESVNDSKKLMLVVEDNKDIADYIRDSFISEFDVYWAPDGKEGIAAAEKLIPDIIISDIMMPVMNGTEFLKRVKNEIKTSHIPVILLTAKDTQTDKEEGYIAGADSYLTKPFSASLLKSRVENILNSHEKMRKYYCSSTFDKSKKEEFIKSINAIDEEFLNKINKLVVDNLDNEKLDIGFVSDNLCMSTSTLYRKVKALTGLSSNEYFRKIKMHEAEKLLLSGKYSISETAYKVGINSPVYFRQCFKDEFGMVPKDYLKQFLQDDNK